MPQSAKDTILSTHPKKLPTSIFHYTPADTAAKILQSRSLHATNIFYLNDSAEYTHAVQIASDVIDAEFKYIKSPSSPTKKILDRFMESVSRPVQNVFAVSFSELPDDLSQWRAYSPNSLGYSLGFSPQKLELIGEQNRLMLSKCIYDNRRKHKIVSSMILNHMIWYHKELHKLPDGADETLLSLRAHFHIECSRFKHPSFKNEKEWRLVSDFVLENDPRLRFRTKQHLIVPYIEMHLSTDDVPWPCINKVYSSPTPHPELISYATELLLGECNIPQKALRSSAIPYRNW